MTYLFHPSAAGEHLETVQHYDSLQPGLGLGYLREFESLMSRVVERPESFPVERAPDVRRASLTRFPYKILYRLINAEVQVLAVAHKRRRPNYWRSRL